jgi:hypothetical protein
MAYYIPSCDIVFIHIPKTGGTSILKWIEDNLDYEKKGIKHTWINKLCNTHGPVKNHFTCVRNPYARILSWFHYQGKKSKERLDKNKARNYDSELFKIYQEGFNYWIKNGNPNILLNETIKRPQTDYYNSDVLFVLKTENLSSDFIKVQKYFNCFLPLDHVNKSKSSLLNYRDEYDLESKKIVSKLYEKDLDLLKYSF